MLSYLLPIVQTAHAALGGIEPVGAPGSGSGDPVSAINSIYTSIFSILTLVAGALAVLYIIWAGIQYISSAGNAEKAKSARTAIINGVIGVIIVISAYAIIKIGVLVGNEIASNKGIASTSGGSSTAGSSTSGTTPVVKGKTTTIKAGQTYKATQNQTIVLSSDSTVKRANGTEEKKKSGNTVTLKAGDTITPVKDTTFTPSGSGSIDSPTIPKTQDKEAEFGIMTLKIVSIDKTTDKVIGGAIIYMTDATTQKAYNKGTTSAGSGTVVEVYKEEFKTMKLVKSGYKTCFYQFQSSSTQGGLAMAFKLSPGSSSTSETCDARIEPLTLTPKL